MYKQFFGKNNQIQFPNENGFYQFLGYLAKSDGSTRIVHENNQNQGAWGPEIRIHVLKPMPSGPWSVRETAGNGGIISRINCNEFLENIINNHSFVIGNTQDVLQIRQTVPQQYLADFDAGLSM
ncbi:MAG: hypothetical protein K5842_02935 [Bacteroidales bacterium]|nr:hypothetical protein [Bacteroidales bacterium]